MAIRLKHISLSVLKAAAKEFYRDHPDRDRLKRYWILDFYNANFHQPLPAIQFEQIIDIQNEIENSFDGIRTFSKQYRIS